MVGRRDRLEGRSPCAHDRPSSLRRTKRSSTRRSSPEPLHRASFRAAGRPHRFLLAGADAERIDLSAVVRDAKRAIEQASALFSGLPYDTYTFLGYTAPPSEGMGGLEHRHGCALAVPSDATATAERRTAFAGLVAHEHFHAWNVKRITDAVIDAPDLTRELRRPCFGSTRVHVVSTTTSFSCAPASSPETAYLRDPRRPSQRVGRDAGSVGASASRRFRRRVDQVLKKNDEWRSVAVSYYAQGALCAAALDLEARAAGAGQVNTLMRALWERADRYPFREAAWLETAIEVFGSRALAWPRPPCERKRAPDLASLLAPPSGSPRLPWNPRREVGSASSRAPEGGRPVVEEDPRGKPGARCGTFSAPTNSIAIGGRRIARNSLGPRSARTASVLRSP
jgi:predicted metalloprotease with PDZ domain